MKLSDKLLMLCGREGWEQADLARAIHRKTGETISRASVNTWVNDKGRPDLKSGLLVARTFGVPLDYLADDELDQPPVTEEFSEAERGLISKIRELEMSPIDVVYLLPRREKTATVGGDAEVPKKSKQA